MVDLIEFNRGVKYLNLGKYDKAVSSLKKVGAYKEALLNLGSAYNGLQKNRLARAAYKAAASDEVPFLSGEFGPYAYAENNLGLLEYKEGRSGIDHFIKAISYDENYGNAHWNLSGSLLRLASSGLLEYWDMGWDEYEWRFKKEVPVRLKIDTGIAVRWQGEPGDVCVLAEQGLGDQFMWGRYLSSVKEICGGRVVVQCDSTLEGVFRAAGFETCYHVSSSGCKYSIPMCSLAKAFGFGNGSWLADVDFGVTKEIEWKDKPAIGVVWSGSASHTNDSLRSVNEHRFHRLAKYVDMYSLNPFWKGSRYISKLEIGSWLDTLAYIRSLDLVITVDTSVAHACGALGVECWVLMPLQNTDFRWGTDALGMNNLWYPSVKVYRNPNDWGFVFDRVEEDLRERYYV